MLGISKKTVHQLVKEFFVPFLIATVWTTYVVWGPEVTVKDVISNFLSSFFLASWMTGQIVRVRKQAGMEENINKLQVRLETMVNDFEEKALSTISHITGGDSYCIAEPQLSRPTYFPIRWDVKIIGAFPMYQVTVKIDDLDSRVSLVPGAMHMKSEKASLGDIPVSAVRYVEWEYFKQTDPRNFTITFEARNGIVLQDVRIKCIDGVPDFAYRIRKNDELSTVIKEVVPAHFPLDEHGKFDWSAPPVSARDDLSFPSYLSSLQ